MIKKNLIFILLLLGFIFRIIISFQNYSSDVTNHMIWGQDAIKNGLPGLYDRNFEKLYGHTSPNYPPITILVFAFLYSLKNWIYQFAWFLNLHISFFPSNLIYFLKDFDYYPYLLKLPAILADIGIAYMTYLFVKKIAGNKKSNWPITSATLVLFNPAYFYNSAIWGQTDSIPLFFILASFYILLFSKNLVLSSIFFTLGILSKQTVVIFTPLFLIILYLLSTMKTFIKTLLVPIIVIWLFFLPFYRQGNILIYPFSTFINKILLTSGLPYTSNHAFNFWYLLTGSRKILASSKFIFNLSYEVWGIIIAGITSVIVFYILTSSLRKQAIVPLGRSRILDSRFHGNDNVQKILYAGFLIPLACFVFLTKMHERHLILTLPFLLLLTYRNKFLLFSYLFISLFNFLNMYHNWWFPNIKILMFFLSSPLTVIFLTYTLIGIFILMLKNYFFVRNK